MIEKTPKVRDCGLLPPKCWYCGVRFQEGEFRKVTVADNGFKRMHLECFDRYMNSDEKKELDRRKAVASEKARARAHERSRLYAALARHR